MNPWIVLTSLAALLFYFATSVNVALNRRAHGVHAPAMTGHPQVERALRVQGNTLEWLAIFLPSLWMFSFYWKPTWAVAFGLIWILGRILYMIGYMQDVAKRGPGFLIQSAATAILLFGAAAGAIKFVLLV